MAIEYQLDPSLSRRERDKRTEILLDKILHWQSFN